MRKSHVLPLPLFPVRPAFIPSSIAMKQPNEIFELLRHQIVACYRKGTPTI